MCTYVSVHCDYCIIDSHCPDILCVTTWCACLLAHAVLCRNVCRGSSPLVVLSTDPAQLVLPHCQHGMYVCMVCDYQWSFVRTYTIANND